MGDKLVFEKRGAIRDYVPKFDLFIHLFLLDMH